MLFVFLEVLNDKYRYKNAKRDETNYLHSLRQFFVHKSVAERTNLFAMRIIIWRGKTSLRLPDCCCHCERFRVIFIRIYDTKSELSARVKLSANRLKIGQTVHFAEE